MPIRLPTSLTAPNDDGHSPVLRLSSLAISLGSIIACAYAMTVDGPNYIIVPPCLVAAYDLLVLFRADSLSPKITGKMEVFCCVAPFGFAVIYCLIVFGNVGFGCVPGADQHWCSDMTKASASEGAGTLLLFPLA